MWPGVECERCQNVAVWQMVLKSTALLGPQWDGTAMQVTQEVTFTVTDHPIAKNQIMHPPANVYWINLNESKVRQDCIDAFRGRIEQHCPPMKPTRV